MSNNIFADIWRLLCYFPASFHVPGIEGNCCLKLHLGTEWHFHCLVSKARKCSGLPLLQADWELPYLNFHCWSVDGSDSMSINKQYSLKHTFTFLQSTCSLNPFAAHVNVYLQTFFLFVQIHLLVFNFTSAEDTWVYSYFPMQLWFTFCKSQKFPRWTQHLESCYLWVF